mgnify:CR=1 FL=1
MRNEKLIENIQNPTNIIPEDSDNIWVRGGLPTRQWSSGCGPSIWGGASRRFPGDHRYGRLG